MSPARVTNLHMSQMFLADLNAVTNRMSTLQQQLSTQQRINKVSDDPFGAGQAIAFSGQLADISSFKRNVNDSLGFLRTAESALGNTTSTLQRVRELMVQAANGPVDQNGANSIAAEITQLKEAIRDQANSQFGGNYLFSGTGTATQPYPAPGNAYAGQVSPALIARRVEPGSNPMTIGIDGPTAFGATTGAAPTQLGLFDLMDRIVADLQSGVPADREELRTTVIDALDLQLSNVTQQRAVLGSQINRLESTESRLGDLEGRISDARSKLVDVDAAQAIIEYQGASTMYQAALAAGTKMMGTSILDFI